MAVSTTINYDSFFTSTTQKFETELQKNFIAYRPGVNLLMDSYGHKESGGWAVQTPLEYGNNSTTKFFQPYDSIDTTPSEFAVPALYNWRQVGSSATVSEVEKVANSGKEKLFDLTAGRIRQAVRSMTNLVSSELYSDGTSFGGNTFQGLAAGISTTPTSDPSSGAVGGVSAASYVWWQNNATTSAGSFAAHGVKGSSDDLVFQMFNNCTDGDMDRPTAILSAQDVFGFYNQTLLSTVRYVDPLQKGDLSFGGLYYQDMPWYWDRMCPAGRMYFVNTKYVHFYVDPMMMFRWTEPRTWPNQVVDIRLLLLRLTLVYKDRMFLGVIDGFSA